MKYPVGYKFYAESHDWDRDWVGEIIAHGKGAYLMKLVPVFGHDKDSYRDNPFDNFGDKWMDECTRPLTPLEQLL